MATENFSNLCGVVQKSNLFLSLLNKKINLQLKLIKNKSITEADI